MTKLSEQIHKDAILFQDPWNENFEGTSVTDVQMMAEKIDIFKRLVPRLFYLLSEVSKRLEKLDE